VVFEVGFKDGGFTGETVSEGLRGESARKLRRRSVESIGHHWTSVRDSINPLQFDYFRSLPKSRPRFLNSR